MMVRLFPSRLQRTDDPEIAWDRFCSRYLYDFICCIMFLCFLNIWDIRMGCGSEVLE